MDINNSISGRLENALEKTKPINALLNIERYNNEMTISQVVRYFERQGLSFTKTMIQNYVRVGILPPPVEKRYYLKKHLILLTLINSLKDAYSLEEIGLLFKPVMKDSQTFDDDVIDIAIIYDEFQALYEKHVAKLMEELPEILTEASKKSEASEADYGDRAEITEFITLMNLMVQTVAAKKIVKNMLDNVTSK